MDENNTNGFGNTDDEYEDEGTTVLTTPGVSAFANAQGAGQSGDASDVQPHPSGQPEQQNMYGGFGQFQQPGQPEQQNNQYGGFNQFQQPGQPGRPEQQNNQYGGFNQFQQPGQQNQYGQPGPQAGVPQGADMKPGMKLNKKLVAIIGGIVAVVIIVIIVLVLALSGGKGQRSATKIGDELAKAYENGDADAMIELMKDDYYELYNETWGDNFVEDQFNEDVQDMKEEVGTVKSIKIEDRSEEKYEKDEIEDVNKTLDRLNVDMKVDDCLEIDMDVEIKGSEDDADGKITYTVVKSGSKWYLVDYDLYVY